MKTLGHVGFQKGLQSVGRRLGWKKSEWGEGWGGWIGGPAGRGERGGWPRAPLELLSFESPHPGPRAPACLLGGLAQGRATFFMEIFGTYPLDSYPSFQLLFLQTPEHEASRLPSGLGVISWTWPPACSLRAQPALAQGHAHPGVDAIGRDGARQRPLPGWRGEPGRRTGHCHLLTGRAEGER